MSEVDVSKIKAVINISIDDISPHPQSSYRCLKYCNKLIDLFPNIKISLFVPTAYWRTVPAEKEVLNNKFHIDTITQHPLFIDKDKKLCKILMELPKENFEVCYHGFYHGIPGESNNCEFKDLTFEQSKERFGQMMQPVEDAGLAGVFKKIFRPPSWYMSSGSIVAAQKLGFKYLSLAPEKRIRKFYDLENKKHSNITYYNICPPYKEYPKDIYWKNNIVFHACEWSKNYLGKENFLKLVDFIRKNEHQIFFGFTEKMALRDGQTFLTLEARKNMVSLQQKIASEEVEREGESNACKD